MSSPTDLSPIPSCSLGNLVAENDQNLQTRYVPNPHYDLAESLDSNKIYFVGKKGFGKSALLSALSLKKPRDHIVDLRQQNIGLDLLDIDGAIASLPEEAQSLIFKGLWKAALMVAIHHARGIKEKKRFGKTEPEKAFLAIRNLVSTKASVGFDMCAIFTKLVKKLSVSFERSGRSVSIDVACKQEGFTQKLSKEQILHQIHLAMKHFEDLLEDQDLYVLIDDLDQEWSNTPIQNLYLSALTDAIEKFGRIPRLKFAVGVRLDIFSKLNLQNPDKIIQNIHRLYWTRETLRKIVEQRLREAFDEPTGRTLRRFNLHKKSGNAIDNILLHCFPHPRDAIWTFQSIMNLAHERQLATVDQSLVDHALQKASANRIRWVCAEWKHAYPWLQKLLQTFRDCTRVSTHKELTTMVTEASCCQDPSDVILALLQTGLLGVKSRLDDTATFFIADDPSHLHTTEKSNFYEWHSAIAHALRAGTWG